MFARATSVPIEDHTLRLSSPYQKLPENYKVAIFSEAPQSSTGISAELCAPSAAELLQPAANHRTFKKTVWSRPMVKSCFKVLDIVLRHLNDLGFILSIRYVALI